MGNLFLFIVILILTICSLLNKFVVGKINPFTIQMIHASLNILLLPLWYLLSKKYSENETLTFNITSLAVLAGLLSSLGFILFLAALKDKPVFLVTAILSIHPSVTMLICALNGSEKITVARVLGVLSIILGIFLIQAYDKV